MVPITRRASSPNIMLYFLINNKAILIRSMLAACVVQDTFVGEAVEGEGCSPGHVCWRSCTRVKEEKRRLLEATSTALSTATFTAQARKSSVS